MKRLLASTVLAAAITSVAGVASAEECGRVTIANMNWQSAEVIANIDKIILEEGYGCDAELVIGDTVPTLTSMTEKGEPDIARSEERRVGKECGSTCRYRGAQEQ